MARVPNRRSRFLALLQELFDTTSQQRDGYGAVSGDTLCVGTKKIWVEQGRTGSALHLSSHSATSLLVSLRLLLAHLQ